MNGSQGHYIKAVLIAKTRGRDNALHSDRVNNDMPRKFDKDEWHWLRHGASEIQVAVQPEDPEYVLPEDFVPTRPLVYSTIEHHAAIGKHGGTHHELSNWAFQNAGISYVEFRGHLFNDGKIEWYRPPDEVAEVDQAILQVANENSLLVDDFKFGAKSEWHWLRHAKRLSVGDQVTPSWAQQAVQEGFTDQESIWGEVVYVDPLDNKVLVRWPDGTSHLYEPSSLLTKEEDLFMMQQDADMERIKGRNEEYFQSDPDKPGRSTFPEDWNA